MKKGGQAATEYIIIVGFVFFALIVSVSLLYKQGTSSYTDIVEGQITRICLDIADLSESTYYMGTPSRQTIETSFPEGITQMAIYRNAGVCTACTEIRFNISTGSGHRQIICSTNIDIRSDLTSRSWSSGLRNIRIEAYDDYVYLNMSA
ncbi:MAG: hypothetical protein ABIC95_05320 [archaeon]